MSSTEFSGAKGPCKTGGSEFTSATGTTYTCDGEKGAKGATGSPWTAGGTLPGGQTETGTYAYRPLPAGSYVVRVPISFPVPLAERIPGSGAHFVTQAEVAEKKVPVECTVKGVEGTAAEPLAEPGNICIYEGEESEGQFGLPKDPATGGEGVGRAGAILQFGASEGQRALGTWAVTAPLV